ncbi:hypothetical protein N752_11500 [Desulforamulus aquiferis]|nr:hypothetical protein [Desulforamulus aquiferis]RYD04982.1 hypothetical protein N752_11500 [Desulforamulus aquiferis]
MCIWTNGKEIKALTIMCFDSVTSRVGILTIPVFTTIEHRGKSTTIGLLWEKHGRIVLKDNLERLLGVQIDGQITFDQPVVEKASSIVGTVDVKGNHTTLLQAFEDTRTERRKDDQDVVRAMASSIISPNGIKKVPQLLWLFSTQVDTDIRPELMLKIYRVVNHRGPTILTKKALRGKDYYQDGLRYRYVEPATWKSIMGEVSTVSSLCHGHQQAEN